MKYSVLTYIFGGYDVVREVIEKDPQAEYILVTDDRNLSSRTWTVVYAPGLEGMSTFDKCYHVRFHPFEYVNTDICIRIDGSILIKSPLSALIDRFDALGADMCLMSNPMFQHLHEDYDYWTANRNYPAEDAEKSREYLLGLGYDKTYNGYYQLCFTISRNCEPVNQINEKTYSMLKQMGHGDKIERFDQPVFSFVVNKYYEGKVKVMMVDEYLITFSKYLQWYYHNSLKAIPFKRKLEPSYLFDEPVVCERFDYVAEPGNPTRKLYFFTRKLLLNIKNCLKVRRKKI